MSIILTQYLFFLYISIMKAHDNIPEAEHRALKNTIKDDYTEMIITLKDFHVAECIVCNNVHRPLDHRSILGVQNREGCIYSSPRNGPRGCCSSPYMGSRDFELKTKD